MLRYVCRGSSRHWSDSDSLGQGYIFISWHFSLWVPHVYKCLVSQHAFSQVYTQKRLNEEQLSHNNTPTTTDLVPSWSKAVCLHPLPCHHAFLWRSWVDTGTKPFLLHRNRQLETDFFYTADICRHFEASECQITQIWMDSGSICVNWCLYWLYLNRY